MIKTRMIFRRFAAAVLVGYSLALSGCFMVESDDVNWPIISPPLIAMEKAAHPLANGRIRVCDAAGIQCSGAVVQKYDDWGYSLRDDTSASEIEFYMRALTGVGIPANTYLVQGYSSDELLEGYHQLAVARRQNDGSWLVFQADCEWAASQNILDRMPWVSNSGRACIMARSGLTDQRLFETLTKATPEQGKARIYPGA